MLWVYGYYKYVCSFNVVFDFSRQNVTSIDIMIYLEFNLLGPCILISCQLSLTLTARLSTSESDVYSRQIICAVIAN